MTMQTVPQRVLSSSRSYLVYVQQMIVAVDISAAIADFVPGANIIVVKTPTEAARAVLSLSDIDTAFLELAPGSEIALRLAVQVRARGGRPVFMGDDADDAGPAPDWAILVRPFSTACIQAILCSALPGVSQRGDPLLQGSHTNDGLTKAAVMGGLCHG